MNTIIETQKSNIKKYQDLSDLKNQKVELERRLYMIDYEVLKIQKGIETLNDKMKRFSFISNFNRIKRKEKKDLTVELNSAHKKLDEMVKKKELLQSELDSLNDSITQMESILGDFVAKPYLDVKDELLLINDSSEITTKPINFENDMLRDGSEELEGLVLVHCTDFFPTNGKILTNYDGNKKGTKTVSYQGVRKDVTTITHRHTVHFTINRKVQNTSDGNGKWEDTKYIIIEPLKKHMSQLLDIGPADSYTLGSVELSNSPYMLVREDCYEDIPEEQLKYFQVILYSGDSSKCLRSFLDLFGLDCLKGDRDTAGHDNSPEKELEDNLDRRDLAVNYIRDNAYNCKVNETFSLEEIFLIYDISLENRFINIYDSGKGINIDKISKSINVPSGFVSFIIKYGIKYDQKGNFYFDSDENIYKVMNDYSLVDLSNIRTIYDLFQNRKALTTHSRTLNADDFMNITIDNIFRFENHSICKSFINSLLEESAKRFPSDSMKVVKKDDGLYLNFYLRKAFLEQNADMANLIDLDPDYSGDEILGYAFTKKIADLDMTAFETLQAFELWMQEVFGSYTI